jgi:hypothetical protein
MNTATGKQIAQERHRYMEGFGAVLCRWEGEVSKQCFSVQFVDVEIVL